MRLLKFMILAAIAFTLTQCSSDQTPIGFEGHQWGTSLEDMRSEYKLEFVDQDQHLGTTTFRTDMTVWDGIPLATCNLSFYEDKLYAVSMAAEGKDRGEQLRNKLKAVYGEGHPRGKASHSWETLGTMINYYYHEPEQTAFVDMMSTLYSASIQKKIMEMALNPGSTEQ